jgi:hypothetical protein
MHPDVTTRTTTPVHILSVSATYVAIYHYIDIMRPQYFENGLKPVGLDKDSLSKALAELQSAIRLGVDLIKLECPPPNPHDPEAFGTIYNGNLGTKILSTQSLIIHLRRKTSF